MLFRFNSTYYTKLHHDIPTQHNFSSTTGTATIQFLTKNKNGVKNRQDNSCTPPSGLVLERKDMLKT